MAFVYLQYLQTTRWLKCFGINGFCKVAISDLGFLTKTETIISKRVQSLDYLTILRFSRYSVNTHLSNPVSSY